MPLPTVNDIARQFRARLQGRERLVGTFVKSVSYQAVEVLGDTGLDFIVLDAEHAPYTRADLDRSLLAAAAVGLPALVRVPSTSAQTIGNALDCGAAGIIAPHIKTAADAQQLVAACRYQHGARGFSNSPRAGGYGRLSLEDHLAASDAAVSIIAQIEDREALEQLAAIMDTAIDACFIGRADLAVSLGATRIADARVTHAVDAICEAARAGAMPAALFLSDPSELAAFAGKGASMFVIGSDLALLRRAASDCVAACAAAGLPAA
jgi:2-keto-3-deoxy-L-rhamnonate aldolase RhmA